MHGGSGGVGHVAVQLAKHFGAEVYATGGGGKQLALIEQLGATPINYKTEEVEDYVAKHTGGTGFDIVYGSVGEANMLGSFNAAALNGHVASTVSLCELDLTVAHSKGLSLHVVFMLIPILHNFKREEHAEILRNLPEIAEAGALKPVLDENRYSLEQAGEAHARLESGKGVGMVWWRIEPTRTVAFQIALTKPGRVRSAKPFNAKLNGKAIQIDTGEFTELFAPLDAGVPVALLHEKNRIEVKAQTDATNTSVQLVTYRTR